MNEGSLRRQTTISSCNKLNEPPDLNKQQEQPPQTVTKFFWTVIDKIKFPSLSIPYLLKNDDVKYLSVRIIERTILSKYENNYSDEVKQFGSLNSELCTESDVVVLNEINDDHLNKEYGHEPFTIQDTLVQLKDFLEFYEILSRTCRTKDEIRLNNNLTNVTRIQQQPPQQQQQQPPQQPSHQQQQPPPSSSISYLASNSIYQNQPHTSSSSSSLNIPDFVFNSNSSSSIFNQSQNNHRQQQPPPPQQLQRPLTQIQPMTNTTNVFRNERENNNIYGQIPNNFQRNHHHHHQQLPPLPPQTSSFLPNLDMIDNTIQLRNNMYQNRSNFSLNQDSQRLNSHHFNQNNQQSMINNNLYQQQQHNQIDLPRRNINSPTNSINSNEILSRLHQNHHMHHQPQPQPIQPQQQFYSNPNSNTNISARLNMEQISSNFIQQPSVQRPQVQRPINVPVHILNQQPLQINNNNNRNMVIQHESLPQPITSNNELFYNNNSLDNLNSMRLARSSQTPILNSSSPVNNLLMSQQKQINKTTNSNIIDALGNNNNQPVLNRQANLVNNNNNNNQFSQPIQYNRISNSLSCQHPTVNINNHHHHHQQQQHHHQPLLNSPTPPLTPTPNNLVYPNHSLASSSIILPSPPILPPPLPQQQFINKQSINNPIISYSDQLVTGASSSSVAAVPVPVISNNLDRTSRNSIDSNSNSSKTTYFKIKQQISDSSLNSSLNEQEITNDDDDCIILDEESESEPGPVMILFLPEKMKKKSC